MTDTYVNGFDGGRGGRSSKASRETYRAVVAPRLSERQDAVLAVFLKRNKASMKQVAEEMHVPLHTISGRGGELVKLGLLRRTGVRVDDSEVLELVVANAAGQVSLFGEAA